MKLLIDADPIVYRSGFAVEKKKYTLVAERAGKMIHREFEGKREMSKWLDEHPDVDPLDTVEETEAEPVENALYLVNQTLNKIEYAVIAKANIEAEELRVQAFLTGPGNYREQIAKQRVYKGNRDPNHKPKHYQAIRDHIYAYGARVVEGREADDQVSIEAHAARKEGVPYVVATIDKDLDQIPGLHYDYRQHVFYDVSEDEARRVFWIQVLAGDPTDNIPGAFKLGPKKSAEWIDNYFEAGDEHLWRTVVSLYIHSSGLSGCPYSPDDAESVALETARLVYLQQEPGELWNPPGVAHGKIEETIDD